MDFRVSDGETGSWRWFSARPRVIQVIWYRYGFRSWLWVLSVRVIREVSVTPKDISRLSIHATLVSALTLVLTQVCSMVLQVWVDCGVEDSCHLLWIWRVWLTVLGVGSVKMLKDHWSLIPFWGGCGGPQGIIWSVKMLSLSLVPWHQCWERQMQRLRFHHWMLDHASESSRFCECKFLEILLLILYRTT